MNEQTGYKIGDFLDDRYKLTKLLGDGRVGKVYLAEDNLNQKTVAVKILKQNLDSERESLLFEREFLSIKNLNHPGVVKVFEQGSNYFTMEYVEGKSLKTLKDKEFSRIFEVCIEITRILDYVHGQGVIHRDLKPDNIKINRIDKTKILDFGFATCDNTQNFMENEIVVGTLDYMAPEMIKGFQIDPRADLYSLGIIFYELVTGCLPFKSADILTTVVKQVASNAILPSKINKRIVPGFENIIMKLIEKTPSKRFQSTEELLSAMLKLAGRSEILSIRIERGRKLLEKPSFSGREKEISLLSQGFSKLLKGKNYFTVIYGEGGWGKTFLMKHFYKEIQEENLITSFVNAQTKSSRLYPIFQEMILGIVEFFEKKQDIFDEILERWDDLLYSICPDFFEKGKFSYRKSPQKLEEKLIEDKICEFFSEISRYNPIALFIDDLHLLDKKNCQLLLKFIQHTKNIPLFLCGAYQKQSEGVKNYFEKTLSRLKWEKLCQEIKLEPLSKEEVASLFSSMLKKENIDDEILDKIYNVSRGIPILVEETTKKLADDMLIYKKGGVWQIDIDDLRKIQRPSLLEENLLEKYKNLSEKETRIVQLAAVAGHNFDKQLLNTTKISTAELEPILKKLIQLGFITENNDSFVIGSLRLAKEIYNEISFAQKQRIHKEIAENLSQNIHTDKQNVEEIAYHYLQTQHHEKTFLYLEESGDLNSKQYLYNAAIEYYQKALGVPCQTTSQQKLNLLVKLGDRYKRIGKYSDALNAYENALSMGKHENLDVNIVYKGIGDVCFKKGLFEKSIKNYQILLEKLRSQGKKIAEELSTIASIYIVMGLYAESEKLLKESLELARNEKNYELQASLYCSFAEIYFMRGQLPNTMTYYLRAFETIQLSGNLHLKAKVARGVAHTYIRKGQVNEAYRYLEEGLYICEMINDRELFIMIKIDLGWLFEFRGQFNQSLEIYNESLELAQEIGSKLGEAHSSLYLARAMHIIGKDTEAIELGNNCAKIFDELKIQWASAEAYRVLGEIYCSTGQYEAAEKEFTKSQEIFMSINMKWALSGVYLGLSKVYQKSNKNDQVNKILNKALRLSKKHDDDIMIGKVQTQYAIFCADNGHNQEALEHFVSAIVFLDRISCKLELAKTYFEYGKTLLDFDKRGDKGFIRVAINQLEKAKDIYQQSGITPMLNKTMLLIKECEREKVDLGRRRDIKIKLRELGQEILQVERDYQKQVSDLQSQLSQMGEEMNNQEIKSIETKIENMKDQFLQKLEELNTQNNNLMQQVDALKTERESLLTLQKISNTINSVLESKKLFDLIMDMAIRELKAERGFVVLKKNEDDFSFKAARNIEEEELSTSETNLSTSIVRKVIKTGEPILTSDAQADGRFQSQSIMDLKLRSILCVPLVIKEKTIGAVYVDNRFVSGLFTPKDLDFLVAFSNQAAIALENAFLYEELREKERIEQEISIAAKIQEGLLPKTLPDVEGIEVYGKMIPARQVGGDYYDFIVSPNNDTLSIAIGDVSGKGVPAGLVMVMARLILHHFLYESNHSTKETLLATNRLLKDNTEPFIFMSMLLVRWSSKKQKLVYTGAGHENLIILRKAKSNPEVIPAGGVVLGVKDNIEEFLEEKELQLAPGDSVIFYTDGVTEAMSPSGDMLEMDGFLEIIHKHKTKSPKDMVYGILDELNNFMKEREQHDDITLTILRKLES